jgi:CubicO group peptidase (beta-lactamase class C family)
MTKVSFLNVFAAPFFAACFLAVTACSVQRSSDNSSLQRQGATNQVEPKPDDTRQPAHTSYDFTAIDRILERAAPQLGGCALVLIQDDKVVYRKSFGRFEADKVVAIASASKWLSGALLMTLVEEGRISLDDSVSKYIPEFGPDKSEITIRHLFAHTSGLPPEARCRNDKRKTLEHCANEIARMKLRTAPGEEFFYAGVSMHVGGRIAEVVSGKSWNELFEEKIAAPLGMAATDFFAYGSTQNPRPAGDARSSADDYGRFLQMILQRGTSNGKQILSASSVVEMHKDQTSGARIGYTIYEKHAARDPSLPLARYGLGVWREKVDDASRQLREASSQGALGFTPWVDVERSLAGVLSVQSSFSRVMPVYLELKQEIRRIVPVSNSPSASEIN